jgi:hypothetical protein
LLYYFFSDFALDLYFEAETALLETDFCLDSAWLKIYKMSATLRSRFMLSSFSLMSPIDILEIWSIASLLTLVKSLPFVSISILCLN